MLLWTKTQQLHVNRRKSILMQAKLFWYEGKKTWKTDKKTSSVEEYYDH